MNQVRQPPAHRPELARAYALLRDGQIAQAEALVRQLLEREPRDARALHALGLIRRDAGDAPDAERLLAQSIELEPGNADLRANMANFLRSLGRLNDSEREFRAALDLNPQHRGARYGLARILNDQSQFAAAEAECRTLIAAQPNEPRGWTALALTLRDQNRWAEAEAAYRQAIAVEPRFATAHHNLAAHLSQMDRAEEALAALERAQGLGLSGFEAAFTRGRALTQLYRMEDAEQSYLQALELNPRHADAQLHLARLRYLRSDPEFARNLAQAADAHREDPALRILLGSVLRQAGDLDGAHAALRDVITRHGPNPEARAGLAQVLQESGRLKEAESEAMEAAIAKPQDSSIVEVLVAILLSRGRAQDAQPFIEAQRARLPNDQGWIAYEATAARLLELPLYRQLYDYNRLVRTYDLEAPPGWGSMKELNAALLESLNARLKFATHPLEQTVRNGVQTARSLVTDPDPAIQAVMRAFEGPVQSYREAIGTDSTHPLSARNRGVASLSAAWSAQLRREGFHLNHVHPHGWISSAYYVSVPDETQDLELMAGWLKFGEPRHPVPGAAAEVFIKPQAGRLVLFPSYLWHGTNPLHGFEPRTAISFDVVPLST